MWFLLSWFKAVHRIIFVTNFGQGGWNQSRTFRFWLDQFPVILLHRSSWNKVVAIYTSVETWRVMILRASSKVHVA